jgi:hypothetical protein
VSLRFRSELRLQLHRRSCVAELLPAGWSGAPGTSASGSGDGASALTAALSALQLAEVHRLPRRARLIVADEFLYYLVLDEDLDWAEAEQEARARLSDALGITELHVQVLPLAGGRRWLAAAVTEADLAAWTDALALAGIRIHHLHPALIEDLRHLTPQIPEDDAVIGLLRDDGISLVRLVDGLPAALGWERLDPGDVVTMEQRLRAFVRESARSVADRTGECVVYLLPHSKTLCRYVWSARSRRGLVKAPRRSPSGADAAGSTRRSAPAASGFSLSRPADAGPSSLPAPAPEPDTQAPPHPTATGATP